LSCAAGLNLCSSSSTPMAVCDRLCTKSPARVFRRLRAAVETARYERRQACLRRLPAPPPPKLLRVGGESPQGDLGASRSARIYSPRRLVVGRDFDFMCKAVCDRSAPQRRMSSLHRRCKRSP
jgi:hypothetical protein